MTSPPILRIYRGLPSEHAGEACNDNLASSRAKPLYPVAVSAAIHLLVLVPATVLWTLDVNNGPAPLGAVPGDLPRIVFIAFILAQCGLGAILFARSSWSLSVKALVAAIVCGSLWLLLVATMQKNSDSLLIAVGWAASIFSQVAIVVGITSLLELTIHYEPAASRARFGLWHVLAGTTTVAVALGITRNLAARQGFVLADVLRGDFFYQLQMAGCISATLAIAIYACLRLTKSWVVRLPACAFIVAAAALAAPFAFRATFGNAANGTAPEVPWLFGSEGLFLLGTLLPLQMLRNDPHISK